MKFAFLCWKGKGRITGSIFTKPLLPTEPFTNLHSFTQAAPSPGCLSHPWHRQGRRPSRSRASPAKWLCHFKPIFCSISEKILLCWTAAGAATTPTTQRTMASAGARVCQRGQPRYRLQQIPNGWTWFETPAKDIHPAAWPQPVREDLESSFVISALLLCWALVGGCVCCAAV